MVWPCPVVLVVTNAFDIVAYPVEGVRKITGGIIEIAREHTGYRQARMP